MNEEKIESQENSAKENKTSASSKKKFFFIIGGAVALVVAVAVVVTLLLLGKKDDNSDGGNDSSNSDVAYSRGLEFHSLGDGTCVVTEIGDCKDANVVIPSKFNGMTVVGISSYAFDYCMFIESIEIPDSVTRIGQGAFEGCTSLKSIKIPDGVTEIYIDTFLWCAALTSIEIPDSVTSIGEGAFSNCTALTSIEIPDSVTEIGDEAFYNCTGLTEITIPASVTSIGEWVFYRAENLKTLYYNSVYSDETNLFIEKSNITKVVFGGNRVPRRIINGYTSVENVVIADSVTSIEESAFFNCYSLKSVVIGNGVKSIGNSAFWHCNALESVYITDIEKWCKIDFSNFESNPLCCGAKLYLNGEVVTNLEIPDNVTSIGDYAFSYFTSLESIVIGDGVTSIGEFAFYYCKSLTSIVIPDSVTSIGYDAFDDCTSLKYNEYDNAYYLGNETNPYVVLIKAKSKDITSCNIHEDTKVICYSAFSSCASIESIEIPDSVTSIGYCAFKDCTSLTDVYYTGSEEEWEEISIGSNNNRLANATIHYNYVPKN